ncbi:MAG: mechanosensitive ion channel family protein, partial [Crocosphaera sp.]
MSRGTFFYGFKVLRLGIIRSIILFVTTIILGITLTPVAVGQMPWFPSSGNPEARTQTPWWDPNKAEVCGRLWCSNVHLFGSFDKIFKVAVDPAALENPSDAAFTVEERARQVQNIYSSIYDRVRQSELMSQSNNIDAQIGAITNWKNLFFERDNLGKHPATPKIEIGIKNNQTVIFVPEQLELGLSGQTIVTVNRADSLYQGKSIEDIAKEWRLLIFESINEALWAYEMDYHYPFARWGVAVAIVLILAIPVIILWLIRHLLKVWNRHLRNQLRELKEALTIDAEALSSEEFSGSDNLDKVAEDQGNTQAIKKLNKQEILDLFKKAITHPGKALAKAKDILENTVQNRSHNLPNLSLKRQSVIKRQQNIAQLLLEFLFWIQIFLILLALTLIVLVFPETRRYSYFFFGQAIAIPLIWMSANIADKLSNLLIDYYLNKWAQEAQLINPNSNRYTLRVSTYSHALKSGTTFLFIVIATAITVMVLGIDLTVLASVGGVAFVFAFLSRNVVEDMLNGVLILWTDR